MLGHATQVAALRRLLADRLSPESAIESKHLDGANVIETGIPAIDGPIGGVPGGALTEVVSTTASSGGQCLIQHLLRSTRASSRRVALVDALDAFDPQSHLPDELRHLIWIRCSRLEDALQSADILTRDANLALVVLDLRGSNEAELKRVPATLWYRFQRNVERSQLALVVQTNRSCVGSAQLRISLNQSLHLEATTLEKENLATLIKVDVLRLRNGLERKVG